MCRHVLAFADYINNKANRDDGPSLAMTHHNACFHHNERLTPWNTLMAYFELSLNGEEYLNISPDPDHLRGGAEPRV